MHKRKLSGREAHAPGSQVGLPRVNCAQVKADCRATCSMTHLPTNDHGVAFWNCLNACVAAHGC